MKKESKALKNSANKAVTWIFYICYVLLIVGYGFGMYAMHQWLTDRLVVFEAATQPTVKSEEVFQTWFADPDWELLYEEAGIADTKFEGKDTFVAYMTGLVGSEELTYEEADSQTGSRKYWIQANGQTLGYFTLANQAKANALIPDWKLDEIHIQTDRTQRVTIDLLEGHTAYVNGQPLDDSYTVEIHSTVAEEYLPEGTLGVRRLRQEVSDLLMPPEVTVLDKDGNECALNFDGETGIYAEVIPTAEAMPEKLEKRAIAAGEAYCGFLVNKGTGLLSKYFAPGSQAYRQITAMPRWSEWHPDVAYFDQSLSEYTRYTEDLFSVRVAMTAEISYRYDPDPSDEEDDPSQFPMKTETHSMDTVFFFENRKNGWMVTGMTNDDTTIPTSRVRLTFLYGDTCLSTAFYSSDSTEIYAPMISTSEDQIFSGWAVSDGTTVFICDENGMLLIPEGTVLEPMTLHAVFESANTESEETQ